MRTYRENLTEEEKKKQELLLNRKDKLFLVMFNTECSKLTVGQLIFFQSLINSKNITENDLNMLEEILDDVRYKRLEKDHKEDL